MRKRRRHYLKGELNCLVDDLVHPLYRRNPELMILDAVLHGLVKQNPPETVLKFIRYARAAKDHQRNYFETVN